MTMSKKEFAEALTAELNKGYQPKRIGSWAHRLYLENCGRVDEELEEIMIDLFVLEEGPEFEITEMELRSLIEKLSKE